MGDRKFFLMVVFFAFVVVIIALIIRLIKKLKKASVKANTTPCEKPCIIVGYTPETFLADGKCGWLDIECQDGTGQTVALNFNKKAPLPIYVPLKTAKYHITYRAKSKAGVAASGILKAVNENNGAMGAFANAVYDAGELNNQFSSVVVDVNQDFVLKLNCLNDGFQRRCEIIS